MTDTDLPEVPAEYRWNEIPTTGGNRKWQLRKGLDSSDVLHICCQVHWSAEDGIHASHYSERVGSGYANVEEAMKAAQDFKDRKSAEHEERRKKALDEKNRQYEAVLTECVADPKCLRNLWEEIIGLKDRVQKLEDRSFDDR